MTWELLKTTRTRAYTKKNGKSRFCPKNEKPKNSIKRTLSEILVVVDG